MSGSHKRARALFRQAIKDPAEQGLAQTVWAAGMDRRIEVPSQTMLRQSAEARAREATSRYKWKSVTSACEEWLDEEPFSSVPSIVLSGNLSINLGEDKRALEIVKKGLVANPLNLVLLNNQAYVLARLGRLEEADTIIKQIIPKVQNEPDKAAAVIATRGLIYLRMGLTDEGQRRYHQAYDMARMLDKRTGGDLATRVAIFYTTEASLSGSIDADKDAAMIKAADPEKLKGYLKETYLSLKKYSRPLKPYRRGAVQELVQRFISRLG